jgi:hypothetical protein
MNYDYTSKRDMSALADEIRNTPKLRRSVFYAAILGNQIMRTRWSLHVSAWIIRKARGLSRAEAWYLLLQKLRDFDPDMMAGAITDLADHVENGHDKVDPKSAAGLNGPELTIVLHAMSVCGWRDPRAEMNPVANLKEA